MNLRATLLCFCLVEQRSKALISAGTIEPASFAKRVDSSVLVDRVRMVLEESRDRDEFPKMPELTKGTREGDTDCQSQVLTLDSQESDEGICRPSPAVNFVRQSLMCLVKKLVQACGSADVRRGTELGRSRR